MNRFYFFKKETWGARCFYSNSRGPTSDKGLEVRVHGPIHSESALLGNNVREKLRSVSISFHGPRTRVSLILEKLLFYLERGLLRQLSLKKIRGENFSF